jgi:hypothetical protein
MTLQMNSKGNFNNDLFIKVNVKKSLSYIREGINVIS